MSDEPERRRALSKRPVGYEVGYGKPPAASRFKPGRSGNPQGRPRGAKNKQLALPPLNSERLKEIILQEAYRNVQINDPSGPLTIPMAQAIVRSLAVNAAKGHQRSQRLFTDLLGTTERERRKLNYEWLEIAINYKTEWDRELARRARLGITGPEPLPHPDHVLIDLRAGTATIRGPATKEEKAAWDHLRAQRPALEQELRSHERQLRRPDCRIRGAIEREADRTRQAIAILDELEVKN